MTAFANGYFSEAKIDTDLAAFLVEAMQDGHGSPGTTDEAIARDMKRIMHTLIKQTENVRTGAISLVDSDADGKPDQFKVLGGEYEFEGATKTLVTTADLNPVDNDITYVWIDSANAVQTAVDGTGWPTSSHLKLAEITIDAAGEITDYVDRRPLLYGEEAIMLLGRAVAGMQTVDGKTNVFTVPAGKSAVITQVIIRNPTGSLAGGTDFDLGDGANADTWKTTNNLATMTAITDYMVIRNDGIKITVFNAADVLGIKPVTGATANVNATVEFWGMLI